jgi:hypothetical protein
MRRTVGDCDLVQHRLNARKTCRALRGGRRIAPVALDLPEINSRDMRALSLWRRRRASCRDPRSDLWQRLARGGACAQNEE